MINRFIAKEGITAISIFFIVSIISFLLICDFLGYIALIIVIALIYIYRNPFRSFAILPNTLSPVDGKVISIDRVNNKDIIYINVSLCDSHILRAPKSGVFKVLNIKKGINLDADLYKSKVINEKACVKFDNLKIEFLSGKYNSKIKFKSKYELEQHDKFGVFIHGLVKITLEDNQAVKVKLGQKVFSGETILA